MLILDLHETHDIIFQGFIFQQPVWSWGYDSIFAASHAEVQRFSSWSSVLLSQARHSLVSRAEVREEHSVLSPALSLSSLLTLLILLDLHRLTLFLAWQFELKSLLCTFPSFTMKTGCLTSFCKSLVTTFSLGYTRTFKNLLCRLCRESSMASHLRFSLLKHTSFRMYTIASTPGMSSVWCIMSNV